MTSGKMFWGVGFIVLGALFLLNNAFQVQLGTENLYKLWPAILICFGAGYLIKQPQGRAAIFGAGGLISALVLFSLIMFPFNRWHCNTKSWKGKGVKHFTEAYNPEISEVKLSLSAGAGEFEILSDTAQLIDIGYPWAGRNFKVKKSIDGNKAAFDIALDEGNISFDNNHPGGLLVKLHPAPVYSMNLDVGAASANYDLSRLAVKKLDVEIGAASLKLKLGMPRDSVSEVNFDIGASSVNILVPREAGVELEGDLNVSSVHTDGFTELSDSKYQSDNFATAKKKIFIKADSGVSSFNISRY